MLLDDVTITINVDDVEVLVEDIPDTNLVVEPSPSVIVLTSGNMGARGPEGPRGYNGPEGPMGPQGLEGPIGPQGDQGIQGPEGAPGSAVGSAHYEWKTATDETDPAHGFIKADNADPELYTEFYASIYSKEGAVVRFDQLEVGGLFILYEHGQIETWSRYEVTSDVVVHGSEWFTVPCVFVESGPNPFSPGGNTQVEVQTPIKGEPGPQGPQGPMGATGPQGVQGNTGVQGIQGVKGDTGLTGSQGPQGIQGNTGPQGVKGDTGADSTVPGPTGPQGVKGDTGLTGADSTVPGPPGEGVAIGGAVGEVLTKKSITAYDTEWKPAAPAVDLVYWGDYVPATQYKDGDIVMYQGTPWMAVKPTTTPPDPWPTASPGASLSYDGDYVPATAYDDGDMVVKDGVVYMCVGGPTTVAPDPALWGAQPVGKPSYGTTLPGSPIDGQEAILVDSVTNPSYQWRFRYNAGSSSAYKWEFIGGTPAVSSVASAQSTTTVASTIDLTTVGPRIIVPRAGDYYVESGQAAIQHNIANAIASISPWKNAASTGIGGQIQLGPANIDNLLTFGPELFTDLIAGDDLRIRYYMSTAGTCYWSQRRIAVLPKRVS